MGLADLAIAEGSFAGREVPMTLLLLWAELSARTTDGLELEGIFRLSAGSMVKAPSWRCNSSLTWPSQNRLSRSWL